VPESSQISSRRVEEFLDQRVDGRAPRLRVELAEARTIARRMIEVAKLEFDRVQRGAPGPPSREFDQLERLAEKAASALVELINFLDPLAQTGSELQRAIVTASGRSHQEKFANAKALYEDAAGDGEALIRARAVTQRLATDAPLRGGGSSETRERRA
jgi:hypothetical protein